MSDLNEIERGQICRSAYDSLRSTEFGLSNFPGLLKKIIRHRAWECRHLVTEDGTPKGKVIELASLRELITCKPLSGWGEDPRKIEAVLRDDPEVLAMWRAEMLGQEGGDKKSQSKITCNNITCDPKSVTGTSRAYSIARVQKECDPETVKAVMAGEMSANAALIKAGKRKRTITVPVGDLPATVRALLRHYDATDLRRVINELE